MAGFGISETAIQETPNAITAKDTSVDRSMATMVETGFMGAQQGLEVYGQHEGGKFRADATKIMRDALGLEGPDAQTAAYAGLTQDNLQEMTPEEKDFAGYMSRAAQVAKLSGSQVAELSIETEMRKRIKNNPFMADRYRRIRASVEGDYARTIDVINSGIAAAQAEAKAKAAASDKRVGRLYPYVVQTGMQPHNPRTGEVMSLDRLMEDPVGFEMFENLVMQQAAIQHDIKKYREDVRFGFAVNAEGRADRGEVRDIQKHNIALQEHAANQISGKIMVLAEQGMSYAIPQVMEQVRNLPPAEREAALKQFRVQNEQALVQSLAQIDGIKPSAVATAVDRFRTNFDAAMKLEDLSGTFMEGIIKDTENRHKINWMKAAPSLALVSTIPGFTYAAVDNMMLSMAGDDMTEFLNTLQLTGGNLQEAITAANTANVNNIAAIASGKPSDPTVDKVSIPSIINSQVQSAQQNPNEYATMDANTWANLTLKTTDHFMKLNPQQRAAYLDAVSVGEQVQQRLMGIAEPEKRMQMGMFIIEASKEQLWNAAKSIPNYDQAFQFDADNGTFVANPSSPEAQRYVPLMNNLYNRIKQSSEALGLDPIDQVRDILGE